MKKRVNLILNITVIILTLGAVLGVAMVASAKYGGEIWKTSLLLVAGAIVAGLINAFMHEFGHLIAGRRNGFILSDMAVWFFRFHRVREKIHFDFTLPLEQAGYTEFFPSSTDDVLKRYKKVATGGLVASFICMLIGVAPMFLTKFIPVEAYAFWAMLFPVGVYYLTGNGLPMTTDGAKNDGAVIVSAKKQDDDGKVMEGLLGIQSELYDGKTPAEIDEKYYFELPQLPEDNLNFMLLLNARYNYYLDKGDFEGAKKTINRLLSLEEYMPKPLSKVIKTDALYAYCTFDKNEGRADELMYELQKHLSSNDVVAIRVKTAYLAFIKKEREQLDDFFNKWVEEAEKSVFEGMELFEKKLLERLKEEL